MKRRLNILCVIVMLVLSYSVLEAGYYFIVGARAGVKAVVDKEAAAQAKVMNLKYVSLIPHSFSISGGSLLQDSVYNEKTKTYVPATYSSMAISVDSNPASWELITSSILSLLEAVMYVWAVVLFIRLIISINQSNIFNWKNVRRLHRLGFTLITGFCCSLTVTYISCKSLEQVFTLRGYDLGIFDMVSATMLVLGLCALIVGEVFAIGLKMKEEQDLTI